MFSSVLPVLALASVFLLCACFALVCVFLFLFCRVEVGVGEKVVYSQFVAELQKIETVQKLCGHYNVECILMQPPVAAAAAIAVAAASSAFHARLQSPASVGLASPAPLSFPSPAPASFMPATAAATAAAYRTPAVAVLPAEEPSRVGSILSHMASLTPTEMEELRRSLFK